MSEQPKYVARIRNVHEVILHGASDPQYWLTRLAPLQLEPLVLDGAAEVMLGAFRSRWMGLSFGEAILGVRVRPTALPTREGFFFLQGYNSSRVFTFFERRHFGTPYLRGQVTLLQDEEVGFVVDGGPGQRFGARTAAEPADAGIAEEHFEGPAFLPSGPGHHFGALLQATRRTWPARPGDAVRYDEATAEGVLQPLVAGGFELRRWATSQTAVHARTRTQHTHV